MSLSFSQIGVTLVFFHAVLLKGNRLNASVTTRRTCYDSCVSGAAAELRLKFCVSCGWLGSESDSAATVSATHVSCGRRASDAPNRTQKTPQRRHVQRTGAVPSRYLQRAFAVPPATCPYGGVRVCTSVAQRRCVEGTTHVHRTHGHILPAQSIQRANHRFPPRIFGALTLRFGSYLLAELTITLGIRYFKTINL